MSLRRFLHAAALLLLSLSMTSMAATPAQTLSTETVIDGYVVRHVIFNSTFLQPDAAKAYGLKRSGYESLLNISVNKVGEYNGEPVQLEGTVTNLMQQQKTLDFKEIKEKDAVYYLSPIRVNGEETIHIALSVKVAGREEPLTLEFSHKVYSD